MFLFQDYGEEQPEDVITGSGNGDFDYNFEDYPFEYGNTGGGEQDPDDLENLPGTGHAVLKVLFLIHDSIFQMITLTMESMEISLMLTMKRILQLKNLNSTSPPLSLR